MFLAASFATGKVTKLGARRRDRCRCRDVTRPQRARGAALGVPALTAPGSWQWRIDHLPPRPRCPRVRAAATAPAHPQRVPGQSGACAAIGAYRSQLLGAADRAIARTPVMRKGARIGPGDRVPPVETTTTCTWANETPEGRRCRHRGQRHRPRKIARGSLPRPTWTSTSSFPPPAGPTARPVCGGRSSGEESDDG